ncbi:MAG: flagellar biosynthesis repressor FlbT [Thermomicrobiales bacterium]
MNGRLKLHLKANERLFINGAVIKVDRKVAVELLNDVVFLLESHVMQEEQATTPLRQLYFVVQSMLIEPRTQTLARQLYEQQHNMLILTFKSQDVLEGLVEVRGMIDRGKPFDALKRIRTLFAVEDEILGKDAASASPAIHPGKAVA